mmetsp:Transcript_31989/g.57324  ORF Transcript_31989/g.57324 Transcript_31989/m.57324 type:complete len:214 (-) Transcript_31989:3114-3755(-)
MDAHIVVVLVAGQDAEGHPVTSLPLLVVNPNDCLNVVLPMSVGVALGPTGTAEGLAAESAVVNGSTLGALDADTHLCREGDNTRLGSHRCGRDTAELLRHDPHAIVFQVQDVTTLCVGCRRDCVDSRSLRPVGGDHHSGLMEDGLPHVRGVNLLRLRRIGLRRRWPVLPCAGCQPRGLVPLPLQLRSCFRLLSPLPVLLGRLPRGLKRPLEDS